MFSSGCRTREKGVIRQSPKGSNNVQESPTPSKMGQEFNKEEFPAIVDRPLVVNAEADDRNDRVCTVHMVYGIPKASVSEGHDDEQNDVGVGEADGEVDQGSNVDIKLDMRLQALEDDREMMRRVIVSMQTEKGQKAQVLLLKDLVQQLTAELVLLKEMGQQLHKREVPETKIVKKKSGYGLISYHHPSI